MITKTATALELELELEESVPAERKLPSALAASSPAVRHVAIVRPYNQPVLSIRASVPEADADTFIAEALHDVRIYMEEHHVQPAGSPFSICRPRGSEIDVEAGWPTAAPLAGTGSIHGGTLPRSLIGPETGETVR
jgi:hypothetical protein